MNSAAPAHVPAAADRRRLRLAVAAAAVLMGSGGCTLMGIIDTAVHGPASTPALHVLEDRVTAVLVDDPDQVLNDARVARTLGAVAVHNMRFHSAPATAPIVNADQVARLEARLGDAWHTTAIDDIGRRLSAEQVIYARIQSVSLNNHRGDLNSAPSLRLDVKVIDVQTGARIWPAASATATDGHPLVVQSTIPQRRRQLAGQETPQQTLDQLADAAGLALGQLFYDWIPAAPGGELEKR